MRLTIVYYSRQSQTPPGTFADDTYGQEVGTARNTHSVKQWHDGESPRRPVLGLGNRILPAIVLLDVLRVLLHTAASESLFLRCEPARLLHTARENKKQQETHADCHGALDQEEISPAAKRPVPLEDRKSYQARYGAGNEAHHAEDADAEAELVASVEDTAVEDGAGEKSSLYAAHQDSCGEDAAKVLGSGGAHGHGAPDDHDRGNDDRWVEALGQECERNVHEAVGDIKED